MVCPKCGSQTNGPVCGVCGNIVKNKKPIALIVLSIILAVVIAACAVLFFILPTGENGIVSAAKNYVTAAYYSNNIINNTASYSSYKDFKSDLDIAKNSCGAIAGGAFDFLASANVDISLCRVAHAQDMLEGLDTDAGRGYSGGYTTGANKNINDFLTEIKKDAAIAKDALEKLDMAIDDNSSEEDTMDAIDDAKKALKKANNVKIIVGKNMVSFSSVQAMSEINMAFGGADIVIDKDTLYLGKNNTVLLFADTIGSELTVISSKENGGIVLDTGEIAAGIQNGASIAVKFDDLDEKPSAAIFTSAEKPQFYNMISNEFGLDIKEYSASSQTDSNNSTGQFANDSQGNVKEDIIGTWMWSERIVNPYLSLSGDDLANAQSEAAEFGNPPFTDQDSRTFNVCKIFRQDGTGLDYYLYDDGSVNFVKPFWWRTDESKDIIVYFLGVPDTAEWTDELRAQMQRFQDGDYSDIADPAELDTYRESEMRLLGLGPGGLSRTCTVYEKTSDSTDLIY